MLRIVILVVLAVTGTHSSSIARTWHVTPAGSGDAPTIQAAIDSAAAGDTVLLSAGTFQGAGNREIDFRGKAITVTSQSGAATTTIDLESSFAGFLFQSGEGTSSVVSGITVANAFAGFANTGAANSSSDQLLTTTAFADNGGAVRIASASPTIENNVFRDSEAVLGGAFFITAGAPRIRNNEFRNCTASFGGAIVYIPPAEPIIENNLFTGCRAISGGAINCTTGDGIVRANQIEFCFASLQGGGLSCESGAPLIEANTFLENRAEGMGIGTGGALFTGTNSRAMIRGNLFVRNTMELRGTGAGLSGVQSRATVVDNRFVENTSLADEPGLVFREDLGGGMYFFGQGIVERNVFERNSAAVGAGLYVGGGALVNNNVFRDNIGRGLWYVDANTVSNCTFIGNVDGGAYMNGGLITDCVFENNSAIIGGGVFADGDVKIVNSVFYGNTAQRGAAVFIRIVIGGGIVENCTITDNRAAFGGGVYATPLTRTTIRNSIIAFNEGGGVSCVTAPTIGCSDLFANSPRDVLCDFDDEGGNFSGNPLFCNSQNNIYTLAANSPCLPEFNDCREFVGALGPGCAPVPTGIDPGVPQPLATTLGPAYPNPFNPNTTIRYVIARPGPVNVSIYDARGRRVRELLSDDRPAGVGTVEWDGRDNTGTLSASGVYFVRLKSSSVQLTRKLVLLK